MIQAVISNNRCTTIFQNDQRLVGGKLTLNEDKMSQFLFSLKNEENVHVVPVTINYERMLTMAEFDCSSMYSMIRYLRNLPERCLGNIFVNYGSATPIKLSSHPSSESLSNFLYQTH